MLLLFPSRNLGWGLLLSLLIKSVVTDIQPGSALLKLEIVGLLKKFKSVEMRPGFWGEKSAQKLAGTSIWSPTRCYNMDTFINLKW